MTNLEILKSLFVKYEYPEAEQASLLKDINPEFYDLPGLSEEDIRLMLWPYHLFRGLGSAIKNYIELEKLQ